MLAGMSPAAPPSLDQLATPIAWLDAEGRLAGCTPAFASWLGVSVRRLHGLSLAELDAEGGRLAELLPRLPDSGGALRVRRARLASPGGSERFADLWLARGEDGGLWVEAHPADEFPGEDPATALPAALSAALKGLAHEIRNPLAAINYAVQLLEESPDIPTADRRLLEIIRQQGTRMNGIVENVLGLARREHAKPEHVDLGELVRQFVEEYRQGHPLEDDTLQAVTPKGSVPALIDPRQLQQVLTVLVYNALTYGRMPGQPARVSVRVTQDGSGQPLIEVLDRGPGIPERVQSNLFRPFFTTSSHGTGLGLYIARELCRANQASLDYVPVPGGGACFRLRLQGPAIARRA